MKGILFFIIFFNFSNLFSQDNSNNLNLSLSENYLNQRLVDWLNFSKQRIGQSCQSCHTTLTHSMVISSNGNSPESKQLRDLIEQRVASFKRSGFVRSLNQPWYSLVDKSYSTEAVLNAVSLVFMDAKDKTQAHELKESTLDALDLLWQRQIKNGSLEGSFLWLDSFSLKPFEDVDSPFWGASMVAMAIEKAPESYKKREDVKQHVRRLHAYLAKNFSEQTLHNRLVAVWSHQLGGKFLTTSLVDKTLKELRRLQAPDGSWDIHELLGLSGPRTGDAYATSLASLVLMESRRLPKTSIKNSLNWIKSNQTSASNLPQVEGCNIWFGVSVNKNKPTQFMTDVATSYALKALKVGIQKGF